MLRRFINYVIQYVCIATTSQRRAAIKIGFNAPAICCSASKIIIHPFLESLTSFVRIIFSNHFNVIGNRMFAILIRNKIYTALYQGIQNIMFWQKPERYTENRNKSSTPYKSKDI